MNSFKNKKINVLVVDDEKSMREVFCDMLEDDLYKMYTAEDGIEAIKKVKKSKYDIVFLDVKMPHLTGYQTLLKIKETDPKAKVIMMTGYATEKIMKEALASEAYGCIYKPFEVKEILGIIENALGLKKRNSHGKK